MKPVSEVVWEPELDEILELHGAWVSALEDVAGRIEQGRAALFVVRPGILRGERARFLEPKFRIKRSELDVPDELLSMINADVIHNGVLGMPIRVLLEHRTDKCEGWFAALLRHELEHAIQRLELGSNQLMTFHDLLYAVIVKAGQPNGGRLYNAIPMEADANAAAAMLIRSRYSSELALTKKTDPQFVRAEGPPDPPSTLPRRMEAFGRELGGTLLDEVVHGWGFRDFEHFKQRELSELFGD